MLLRDVDDECTKVQSVIASARKYRRIREELEKVGVGKSFWNGITNKLTLVCSNVFHSCFLT